MFVKNNIAQPGEITCVALNPHQIEVRLRTGKVMRYERKAERVEVPAMSKVQSERVVSGADEV